MASEQEEPGPLPSELEEWVAAYTEETGESRETVLARAVAAYQLLTDGADADEAAAGLVSELESRIDELEADAGTERIDELEADLESHVEDLRSRVVDVMKEAKARAPADHDHEAIDELAADVGRVEEELDDHAESVGSLQESVETIEAELSAIEADFDDRFEATEGEVGSLSESVGTVESKADRLAEVVVDLRRRLQRIESHVTHQTALAELLETAAREDIDSARCDNCSEMVSLPLLAEPACPHCRSVFDGLEPGSMFFKSAWLTVADRPALEAGSTTEQAFDADNPQGRR